MPAEAPPRGRVQYNPGTVVPAVIVDASDHAAHASSNSLQARSATRTPV